MWIESRGIEERAQEKEESHVASAGVWATTARTDKNTEMPILARAMVGGSEL